MKNIALITALVISLCLWNCSENTTEPEPTNNGNGLLKIFLVDSPATLDSIIICVSRVEVHKAGSDSAGGEWFTINDSLRYFDLLSLTNGASKVLGDTSLAAGKYTQIRLIVEDRCYVIDNGTKHVLSIPSGTQTGIKLNHSFTIEDGKMYELYLDFNADKSIIITGNGKYKLKPVIRVIPIVISGSISGQVLPVEAYPSIWTVVDSDTVSTFTDLNGFFKLIALPEGNYAVHITPTDTITYSDTTITNVVVTANQDTNIGVINL